MRPVCSGDMYGSEPSMSSSCVTPTSSRCKLGGDTESRKADFVRVGMDEDVLGVDALVNELVRMHQRESARDPLGNAEKALDLHGYAQKVVERNPPEVLHDERRPTIVRGHRERPDRSTGHDCS